MDNNYDGAPWQNQNQTETKKRPGGLTFLCILTFIVSGISLISSIVTPTFAPLMLDLLRGNTNAGGLFMTEQVVDTYEQIVNIPFWKFCLLAIFEATSILGAIFMLKMNKFGFHLYAGSKLSLLLVGKF